MAVLSVVSYSAAISSMFLPVSSLGNPERSPKLRI